MMLWLVTVNRDYYPEPGSGDWYCLTPDGGLAWDTLIGYEADESLQINLIAIFPTGEYVDIGRRDIWDGGLSQWMDEYEPNTCPVNALV